MSVENDLLVAKLSILVRSAQKFSDTVEQANGAVHKSVIREGISQIRTALAAIEDHLPKDASYSQYGDH